MSRRAHRAHFSTNTPSSSAASSAGAVLTTSVAELYGVYDDNQAAAGPSGASRSQECRRPYRTIPDGRADRDLDGVVPAFWSMGGGTLDQRMNEYQRLLRQSPAFTEFCMSMPAAANNYACRGWV